MGSKEGTADWYKWGFSWRRSVVRFCRGLCWSDEMTKFGDVIKLY